MGFGWLRQGLNTSLNPSEPAVGHVRISCNAIMRCLQVVSFITK